MRRFVDGVEVDLPETGATVDRLGDRLIVHVDAGSHTALVVQDGEVVLVSYLGRQYRIEKKATRRAASSAASSGELRAPMPGQVVDVRVRAGDRVAKGTTILVLEAMKTQQPFPAPFDGVVESLGAKVGDQVDDGALLALVVAE